MSKIATVFSGLRHYSRQLEQGYSIENYEEVLDFISNDFHDFCHHNTDTLDLKKWNSFIKL